MKRKTTTTKRSKRDQPIEQPAPQLVQVEFGSGLRYTYNAAGLSLAVGDFVECPGIALAFGKVVQIGSDYAGKAKRIVRKVEPQLEDEQGSDPYTSKTSSQTPPDTSTSQAESSPAVSVLARKLADRKKNEPTDNAPHIQLKALAGTGKTTSCVEGLKEIKGVKPAIEPSPQQRAFWNALALGRSDSVRISSFNTSITDELKRRLADSGLDQKGCEARGVHSLGLQAVTKRLGWLKANDYVVIDLACGMLGGEWKFLKREPRMLLLVSAVDQLVSLCKQSLSEPTEENLDRLAAHYDVDLNGSRERAYELVPRVLEACKSPKGRITFDDMVWLPIVLGLPIPKVDLQIIDEAQDLNRMQQELIYRAGHRIVFVGDPNQAIYGFAGADSESMPRMERRLRDIREDCKKSQGPGCITLPLTVTRRCGKAIVEEARRYVPEFEAHESNLEGQISSAAYDDKVQHPAGTYHARVEDGNMILCRVNAPLVSQCFKFLKDGRKANIQGRDVGKGLVGTVKKLTKVGDDEAAARAFSAPNFIGTLDDWFYAETAKESAKHEPSDQRLMAIQDRRDCLACFADNAANVWDVLGKINSVFTDNKDSPGIRLSSIHKAKGLEAKRVFLLRPASVKIKPPKSEWQARQERNLAYVAVTRAIEEFVYVS